MESIQIERESAQSATRTSSATLRAMNSASPLGMFLADGSGACAPAHFFDIFNLMPADFADALALRVGRQVLEHVQRARARMGGRIVQIVVAGARRLPRPAITTEYPQWPAPRPVSN